MFVNRGEADLRGELHDAPALQPEHRMGMDKQGLRPCGARCREGRVDLARLPGDEDLNLQTRCRAPDFAACARCFNLRKVIKHAGDSKLSQLRKRWELLRF
jgi:hypothetical protein